MFKINTYAFSNTYKKADFKKWKLENEYHSVYILENGADAYIGETRDVRARALKHTRKHKEQNFSRMHVITGEIFEGTPAEHYEKILIKLFKVDSKFHVINPIKGYRTHYPRKNEFELHFDQLWKQLEEKKLVDTKEFKTIYNASQYKYSPHTALTEEQHSVLTSIVNVLNSEETAPFSAAYSRRPILINGSAGTGKTVIATSLFHYLRNNEPYKNKKIALVYANAQMRNIIKDVFQKTGEGLRKSDVISPIDITKQKYDIIICDEVQSLRRKENLFFYSKNFKMGNERLGLDHTHDELDWIFKHAEHQVLFYDEKQCVKHSDIRTDSVKQRIHHNAYKGSRPIELKNQMRIMAGGGYIPYIYDILRQKAEKMEAFEGYDFKLFQSFSAMRNVISQKDDEIGLSKLCGGYAWKWVSKNDETLTDIVIEGIDLRWNRDKTCWIGNIDSKHEMGSIYTLRGVDLSYAGVVIGPDLYFDKNENRMKVNRRSLYADKDVKEGTSEEELLEYVLNTYAVLLTRAIKGTYVYVCDEALRDYFASYIELK